VHQSWLVDERAIAWLKQFKIDSTLLLSVGHPYEPYLRLAAVENGKLAPVAWPGDLRDCVEITSADEALAFLRLFSGAATWYRFPQFGWLEVRPRTGGTPKDGDMSPDEFARLNLMEPQIIPWGDGFRVLRPAARMDMISGQASEVCILDETVSRNGRYTVRILARRRSPDAGAVWASGLNKL